MGGFASEWKDKYFNWCLSLTVFFGFFSVECLLGRWDFCEGIWNMGDVTGYSSRGKWRFARFWSGHSTGDVLKAIF